MRFSHALLVKRCFPLLLGEGFKVAGCLAAWLPELPSTCSGKIPRNPPFPQSLSCSWLSSCRSRFKSVFSQLLFPGLPAAAAAVHFSWSPFFGRGLSFSPAALSQPPAIHVLVLLPYVSSIPSATTYQALLPSFHTQLGGC